MTFIGVQSLITIVSHMTFVFLTFWALQSLRTENWFKKYHIQQARVLYLLLSIAIGYNVSSFFMEFIGYSRTLVQLFN